MPPWGYNGSLLGPALQLTQEDRHGGYYNQLAEDHAALAWSGGTGRGRRGHRGYRAGCHPHGKLHANAAGGDLLVSSASAWEHRPAGGDGAGRPVLIEDEESGRLLLLSSGESMMCR